NLRTRAASIVFLANAPTDSSTLLLPVLASQLTTPDVAAVNLSSANPRFSYSIKSFDLFRNLSAFVPGQAKYNAYTSAVSQGDFFAVDPGQTQTTTISINPAEWDNTATKGVMVVTLDNTAGAGEAQLIDLPSNGR